MKVIRMLTGLTVAMVAAAALAQTQLDLAVTKNADGSFRIEAKSQLDVAGKDVTVQITCATAADCDGIEAVLAPDTRIPLTRLVTGGVTMLVGTIHEEDVESTGSALVFTKNDTEIGKQSFTKANVNPPPSDDSGGGVAQAADPCEQVTLADLGAPNPGSNDAILRVTPGGSILEQTGDNPIDEDDQVIIYVVDANATVIRSLEVTRTSKTRSDALQIAGGNVDISKLIKQSKGEDGKRAPKRCFFRGFKTRDFEPGEGVVEIASRVDTTRKSLGTVKFKVNTLWHGVISFGPAWSSVKDRDFDVVTQGSDKVIIETEEDKSKLLYAAQYTYFFRGRRDLEKPLPNFMQRINPTIGFSINKPTDHALIGLSADAGHFVLTVGAHLARVTELAKGSALTVGSKFAGSKAEIPREKKIDTGIYFAVTVDTRALSSLLKAITPN